MKGYIEFLQTTNPFILIILHVTMIIFARYIIGYTSIATPWGRKITANESKTVWNKILMGYGVIVSFVLSATIILQFYQFVRTIK
ncbi:MAG: hypothetical protein SCK29_05260 [Bacillota bacterium]|nr:hypothetical protein [Bacillota bacterium]MDW7683511.1 hypothetical protein [Bacillota bacterium]